MEQPVEKVVKLALGLSGQYMTPYGAVRSRKDFTQYQLMACLVLRAYWKTTYRGLMELLDGHSKLRTLLGMEEKLPHYTTLQKFSERSEVLAILNQMLKRLGEAAIAQGKGDTIAAMDSTGLETSTASAHFVSRSGKARHRWGQHRGHRLGVDNGIGGKRPGLQLQRRLRLERYAQLG